MLALTAAGATAVLVALLVAVLVVLLRAPKPPLNQVPPSALPPGALPPSSTPVAPAHPRPASQPASCPDVMMVSIPGTWESSPQDDPLNPQQFPLALLLHVTRPIAAQYGTDRVQTYTVPYTSQFHNPFKADQQMSYNDSRAEGTTNAQKAITDMNAKCPLTSYVLAGFSQGAVIAGDIAGDIGNGKGPVDPDLLLGVTMIADGRRQAGVGQDIGPNPPGEGAEITLHEVPILSSLGMTMTGPRPGGFGAVNDRANEICAAGDLICAAPDEAFNITNLPKTLDVLAGGAGQPVHALYATTQFWSLDGQPATDWTLNWAKNLIDNAPHPKHG
jgi:Cutinase